MSGATIDGIAHAAAKGPGERAVAGTGSVLAFDFGEKRTGVAVGDLGFRQASALGTICAETREQRFKAIGEFIAQWRPVLLLVGMPQAEDGSSHAMTARCARFANQLRGRFHLPVATIDERLSSWEAERTLRGRRAATPSREAIDAEAARIILQSYFDEPAQP